MMKKTFYFFMLILISQAVQSQDYITKKDSTKIEALILEINSSDISYRFYNYQDGPKITLTKSDIAYITNKNGAKTVFASPQQAQPTYYEPPQLKPSKQSDSSKIRMFTLMAHAGFVFNNRYVNVPYKDPDNGKTSGYSFSPASQHTTMSYQFGINALIGKSPFCKFVIGANYLRSFGGYNIHSSYQTTSNPPWTRGSEVYKVNSTSDFINILVGVRFTIAKKLHVENLMAINALVNNTNYYTGYKNTVVYTYASAPNYTVANTYTEISNETINYTHEKNLKNFYAITTTVSFCPRLTYDIKIKGQTFGIYTSYNIALKYRLPWFVAGIAYYPFKKLK